MKQKRVPNPTGKGGMKKGETRNPKGRIALPAELKLKISEATSGAIETIIELSEKADTDSVRLKAAEYIVNRELGMPTQPISNDEEKPFEIKVVK